MNFAITADRCLLLIAAAFFAIFASSHVAAASPEGGTVLTERLSSTILRDNRIGIDPQRTVKIYLPRGYDGSGKSYPVVYYLHNMWWSAEQLFRENDVVGLLDQAFANDPETAFILVAADYTTPAAGTIYEDSPVNGRWLEFTARELVPFIDARFRTLSNRDSRAVVGDFFGGRGALRFAMTHPQTFSVAYALHPVATGTGYLPWPRVEVDWRKIHNAKSYADLEGDGRAQIFVTVGQAFMPNPNRPPFYCDFYMEMEGGEPKPNFANIARTKAGFLLDQTLAQHAPNLRTMRALAFDWGRYDPTPAHVQANEAFSRQLDDLGIEHEAEEFRGGVWDQMWGVEGRFYTRVLPFLARNLVRSGER